MRIEDLEKLAAARRAAEQGTGSHTSQHPYGHVTFYRQPSIEERIYAAVLASGGAVTRGQIARALGLKITPWLIGKIESLVEQGYLVRLHGQWKNGVLMYWYELKET